VIEEENILYYKSHEHTALRNMIDWSLGFRGNLVTFPENLVTFHKLLQPTIAVGHNGSPSGGQTMECHKENDEPNNLQAMMSPTLPYVEQLVRFGALEEVFMSYRPHGAWRTMEVLEELA
jgi:hypothetical protein